MTEEIWKTVPDLGGHYEASNLGRIRTKARIVSKLCGLVNRVVQQTYRARLLKPTLYKGYFNVHLSVDKKKTHIGVARLVLLAFRGPPLPGQECCHDNGDSRDNRIDNLRWDTHASNNGDRKKHGRYAVGEKHPMCIYTDSDIAGIRACNSNAAATLLYGVSRTHAHRVRRKLSRA